MIFRNAKIDMFKGTMRLAVDKWGRIEVTQPADFKVNQDNNMSLVEYELVDVDEEEWAEAILPSVGLSRAVDIFQLRKR